MAGASVYFGDSEYLLSTDQLTWLQHETEAQNWGGHLASVTSMEEDNFINTLQGTVDIWLGAEKSNSGVFFWTDNSSFDYTGWADGKPDDSGVCILKDYSTGRWSDAICDDLHYGVYKQPYSTKVPSKAPSDLPTKVPSTNPSKHPSFVLTSTYFGDSEYVLNPTPMSWSQHESSAIEWGGHLASITSVEEDNWIASVLGSDEVWLGAEKGLGTGTFRWLDLSDWVYDAFTSGEPDEDGGCLLKESAGTWADAACTDLYYGIYKQPYHEPTKLPSEMPSMNPSRQPSFALASVYFGDSEYAANQTPLTMAQHEAAAVEWGGHLVSVTSVEEDNFITTLIGNEKVWLGAEKGGGSGTFSWMDLSNWVYDNYANGEPDGSGNCLLKNDDGTWSDESCSDLYYAIYEQPYHEPSKEPSLSPSRIISAKPSNLPSKKPSFEPTNLPSNHPSENPSQLPTNVWDDDTVWGGLELWFTDQSLAYSTYGNIRYWFVGAITSFYNEDLEMGFFEGKATFQRVLSDWDVSSATSLRAMFRQTGAFNVDISSWDVSNCLDFSYFADEALAFNSPLDPWDVSSGTTFEYMFRMAQRFNQDLSSWDISAEVNFSNFFEGTDRFNQDLSTWELDPETLDSAFQDAVVFNQDLAMWDVSKVVDFNSTFEGAQLFNGDISSWDVSSATNMNNMFKNAKSFNRDLPWDVSLVEDLTSIFENSETFNGDIGAWNILSTTAMVSMFEGAVAFDQDLEWNTGSVVDFSSIFKNAESFNSNISSWDISSATSTSSFFYGCTSFDQDIGSWDVSSSTTMEEMFYSAEVFNQNISSWNVEQVTIFKNTFFRAFLFNQDLSLWTIDAGADMELMFRSARAMNQIICWSLINQKTTNIDLFAPNLEINGACIPSSLPSYSPSKLPSPQPSTKPSISFQPSNYPSYIPSNQPSQKPSNSPSNYPSPLPSVQPSQLPSNSPSKFPSLNPSTFPSNYPSKLPAGEPSQGPSMSPAPSQSPSLSCNDWPYFRWNKLKGVKWSCPRWASTSSKCKRSDKYSRLVKNYCRKTCNNCEADRCEDDPYFYFNNRKINAYSCASFAINKTRCNRIDRRKRRVKEYCRGSCNFCAGKNW